MDHVVHYPRPVNRTSWLIYGLYPVLIAGTALSAAMVIATDASRAVATPAVLMTTIALCMFVEWRRPLRERWSMTTRTLVRRDLPFITVGLVLERIAEIAVAAIASATVAEDGFGPMGELPLVLQVVVAILVFDLLWYSYHRFAHHTSRLWRVHGAHHTPSQMYVLMHGVFHPGDELVVRFVLALLVFRFGGFTPAATFAALVLIGVIGIVSHVNADVRLWALNHLLAGPETHRYHHSATHDGNYGSATTVWDQLFGTFVFHIEPPAALGLADSSSYPDPEHFWSVMAWPLRHNGSSVEPR